MFGLCAALGFRLPRIRDVFDKRLHPFEKASSYPTLESLTGDRINVSQIESQWDELLRLATSIRQGTATASLILRKLASYPRQNGLAWGLRELAASTARCSCSNGSRAQTSAAASPSA